MFGVAIVFGVGVGWLTKGKMEYLTSIKLRGFWFVLLSFAVEGLTKILLDYQVITLGRMSTTLHLITYCLLGLVVWWNKNDWAIVTMGIGSLLNAVVIFGNGGVMPVGQTALTALSIDLTTKIPGMYTIMQESTRFKILADIFAIHTVRAGFIISIGDLLICMGMIAYIVGHMHEKRAFRDI